VDARHIAERALHSLLAMVLVATLIWLLFRLLPGDPTTVYLGTGQLTAAAAAEQRAQWGLDAPLWQQYLHYAGNLLSGNLGMSFLYRRPVVDVLLPALGNTVLLMAPALFIAITLGVTMGAWLGWRRGDRTEAFWSLVVLVPRALPAFWIGMLVIGLFAYRLEWFPIGGMRTPAFYPETWIEALPGYDLARHLALPVLAAAIYFVADPLMIMRSSMLDVRQDDFVTYARARGLSDRAVRRLVRRNALLPVVSYIGVMIGFAFGGQVLLEYVFSWPGIGRMMIAAVTERDYPLAQAAFLLMAVIVIVVNFLADLISLRLDPRLSHD
jgi:peptide/nickel transport system permease protein